MEKIIGYPRGGGGGREEDYEREITWFSGGEQRGNQSSPPEYKGRGGRL